MHNFSLAFSRPGPTTTSPTSCARSPALAKQLTTTSPATVTALKESVPITAFFGPYSPDLAGTLRTFGQGSAYYDADGHYVRASARAARLQARRKQHAHAGASPQQALEGLKTGQLRRCPGAATQPAADGSSPFIDGEMLTCDPTETP